MSVAAVPIRLKKPAARSRLLFQTHSVYQVYKSVTEFALDCWFLEGVDCISYLAGGGNLILNFEF